MEGIELIAFEMISNAGGARSSFIEAIHCAREGDFAGAEAKIKEGEKFYQTCHHVHAELIAKVAGGEDTPISLILIHAEDQMMSAEGFKILSQEFLDLNKKIEGK